MISLGQTTLDKFMCGDSVMNRMKRNKTIEIAHALSRERDIDDYEEILAEQRLLKAEREIRDCMQELRESIKKLN